MTQPNGRLIREYKTQSQEATLHLKSESPHLRYMDQLLPVLGIWEPNHSLWRIFTHSLSHLYEDDYFLFSECFPVRVTVGWDYLETLDTNLRPEKML